MINLKTEMLDRVEVKVKHHHGPWETQKIIVPDYWYDWVERRFLWWKWKCRKCINVCLANTAALKAAEFMGQMFINHRGFPVVRIEYVLADLRRSKRRHWLKDLTP